MTNDVAVAILAGGEGRRIGGGKPLRTVGSERLIDRALKLARQWSNVVVVAARDPIQTLPIGTMVIGDEPNVPGPLGGLFAALKFAREHGHELLLTVPADTPFLPSNLLVRLSGAIGDRGCALATSGGQLHPVCGLWHASSLDRVDEYLSSGDRSLKSFAALIGFQAVEWVAEPEDSFFNINAPADLAEAERRLAR